MFHLAGQPGLSATAPFELYLRNNVTATKRLLEALERSGTGAKLINIATSSVYGRDASGDETSEPKPTSDYGVTKLAAEQIVLAKARDEHYPACSLRLFSVYGERERPEKLFPRLIHSILAGEPFPLYEGSCEHVRSYTYIGDIVDGLLASLERFEAVRGEILNIGTHRTMTTGEGIAVVERLLGRKADIDLKPRRKGDQLRTAADIGKAKRLLDYSPATLPEEGLAKEVAWYRDEVFGRINPYREPVLC